MMAHLQKQGSKEALLDFATTKISQNERKLGGKYGGSKQD